MSTNLNYFDIYAALEKESSDLFNEVNGYNETNGIDSSLINSIRRSKDRILQKPEELNYRLYEKEKTLKSEETLSYDDFISRKVESYKDFKDRFGLSEYKIKELHRMIHSSLEDKYKGANNNYDKEHLGKTIEKSNKSIYKIFHKQEIFKDEHLIFGEQLDTLIDIVYDFSTLLKHENLFAFGNANTSLALASIVGQCNKEIVPMKFDKVPDSLVSIDLKEMTKIDLNSAVNYYKSKEIKKNEFMANGEKYEIKPYKRDFSNSKELIELTEKPKRDFRTTMISYIVVNLPEREFKYLYKDNDFVLNGMKNIANNRLKRAPINLEKFPYIKEPDSANKNDNWSPKNE